jgi:hypothetical protein
MKSITPALKLLPWYDGPQYQGLGVGAHPFHAAGTWLILPIGTLEIPLRRQPTGLGPLSPVRPQHTPHRTRK